MKSPKTSIFALLLSLGMSASVLASPTASDVLNDLHAANRKEIQMGQLAQEKGSTSDTRDYGKQLVKDHQSADEKVAQVASKEGVTLKEPTEGISMRMQMKKLHDSTGALFDHAFSECMVRDHESDIKKLEKAQSAELPTDVRDLIAELLPTLHKHLDSAEKVKNNS